MICWLSVWFGHWAELCLLESPQSPLLERIDKQDNQEAGDNGDDGVGDSGIVYLGLQSMVFDHVLFDKNVIVEYQSGADSGNNQIEIVMFLVTEKQKEHGDYQHDNSIIEVMQFESQEDWIGIVKLDREANKKNRRQHD